MDSSLAGDSRAGRRCWGELDFPWWLRARRARRRDHGLTHPDAEVLSKDTGYDRQRRILERNSFVERLMPGAVARRLTAREMDHYRKAQPSPEARRGVAEMPHQILAARPLLERLARQVPERLGDKPAMLVWGVRDMGFRPKAFLPRVRSTFPDHEVVELPEAKHYIQEDAPDEIAAAIARRFGT